MHFFVPWRNVTIAGTWYWPHLSGERTLLLREEELQQIVVDVNTAYPAADLSVKHISFVHLGILPMDAGKRTLPVARRLSSRSGLIDHGERGGIEGLIGIEGVKYTTGCTVAEKVIRLAAKKLGRPVDVPEEDPLLFRRAPGGPSETGAPCLPDTTLRHLRTQYGESSQDVIAIVGESPELGRPLSPLQPTTGAEVAHAVRHEMACRLADVIFRRTGLGTIGHPGRDVLAKCAAVMGGEMSWSPARREREIAAVEEAYALFPL